VIALRVAQNFKKVTALSASTFVQSLDVIASKVGKALDLLLLKLYSKLNFIFSSDWLQKMRVSR
jgi:hypothetical protein